MSDQFGWTIVQHSGYGYAGKPGFVRGVEVVGISSKTELNLVERAGGVVFPTYSEADDFENHANYPEGHEGLYPAVEGTFSNDKIVGLRIYIPVREVKG